MICPGCHGTGEGHFNFGCGPTRMYRLPCNECLGSGFVHCCEGERSQPECNVVSLADERIKRKDNPKNE